jgi:hypothetical protein
MTPPAATVERSPEDVGHMGPAERLVCPRTSGVAPQMVGENLDMPEKFGPMLCSWVDAGARRRDPWPRTPHARQVLGWSGRQDSNLPEQLHLCLSEPDETLWRVLWV